MTNEIIKLENLELTLTKELLLNPENLKNIEEGIENLTKNVYDFSTIQGIKEAKELKTKANKFVEQLKEFCDPLEADGKRIADARSVITRKLTTGKDNVIDRILAPVIVVEDKLKQLKSKLYIASVNPQSNLLALEELKQYENINWLAYNDEANKLISQQKTFLENEKIKFDEIARIAKEEEERKRVEREKEIEEKAKKDAEEKAKKEIEEANRKAQEAIAEAERRAKRAEEDAIRAKLEAEDKAKRDAEDLRIKQEQEIRIAKEEKEKKEKDVDNKKRIHNEILEDLKNKSTLVEDLAKEVITLIAKNEIRNLTIKY